MKKICFTICALFIPTLIYAASLEPALTSFKGQEGELNIVGGTAPVDLMRGVARRIMAYNPEVRINVDGGGSAAGIRLVGESKAQISNSGRPLKQEEIEKYGLKGIPYAIDGVAVAVNRRNPVSGLSKAQLSAIFSGKITNWRELGGHDEPIVVYVREPGSGARETFEAKGLGSAAVEGIGKIINSNGAMKNAIAQDSRAIGYLAMSHLDERIRPLKIDGVAASPDAAISGKYPLTRYLYMNTKGEPAGLARLFIDYMFSPTGSAMIRAAGYIPNSPKE